MSALELRTPLTGIAAGNVVDPSQWYLRSSFYERLVEHVLISELLQEAWFRFTETIEVLRSEVDSSGYDLALECRGILRHVQLKTSVAGGRTSKQQVNMALAGKPSGCVLWVVREEDFASARMRLRYRFFGANAGMPLPPIGHFKVAKHTKANAQGVKTERPAIRLLPASAFTAVPDTGSLLHLLFGIGS